MKMTLSNGDALGEVSRSVGHVAKPGIKALRGKNPAANRRIAQAAEMLAKMQLVLGIRVIVVAVCKDTSPSFRHQQMSQVHVSQLKPAGAPLVNTAALR